MANHHRSRAVFVRRGQGTPPSNLHRGTKTAGQHRHTVGFELLDKDGCAARLVLRGDPSARPNPAAGGFHGSDGIKRLFLPRLRSGTVPEVEFFEEFCGLARAAWRRSMQTIDPL
jgi:hypothetical protein